MRSPKYFRCQCQYRELEDSSQIDRARRRSPLSALKRHSQQTAVQLSQIRSALLHSAKVSTRAFEIEDLADRESNTSPHCKIVRLKHRWQQVSPPKLGRLCRWFANQLHLFRLQHS